VLKKRIDEIALAMIDKTKKSEESFLKTLKEKVFETQTFESCEDKLNQIEETFRNPNLLTNQFKKFKADEKSL